MNVCSCDGKAGPKNETAIWLFSMHGIVIVLAAQAHAHNILQVQQFTGCIVLTLTIKKPLLFIRVLRIPADCASRVLF